MARRSRNSTGRRRRSYRWDQNRDGSARQLRSTWQRPTERLAASINPSRGRRASARRTLETLSERRSRRRLVASPKRVQDSANSRRKANRLPDRILDRRTRLSPQRSTRPRLSNTVLQVRRTDENASARQTTRSVCTRKKEARRAVIIATGNGGINGVRNYKKHRRC
jgi:chemotaxis response regulator CheB